MDNTKQPQAQQPYSSSPVQPVPQPLTVPPDGKKSRKLLLPLLIIVLVVIGMAAVLLIPSQNKQKEQTATTQPEISSAADQTANWKTYNNKLYGFTMQYPPDYTITCGICAKNGDDEEWMSGIGFNPPVANGYGTIVFGVNSENSPKRNANETIEQYIIRRNNYFKNLNPTATSSYEVVKKFKLDSIDAVQTTDKSKPDHPPYIIRSEFIFEDGVAYFIFSDPNQASLPDMKLTRPITDYPNAAVYEQMLASFKLIDLPKTRKITSSYIPSSDGSYFIRGLKTYGDTVIILDKKGTVISNDVISDNKETYKSFKTDCWECAIKLGTWVRNKVFTIKIEGSSATDHKEIAYEFQVDASTGKIDPKSFKKIK